MTSLTKRLVPASIALALIFTPLSVAGPQSSDDQKKSDKPVESPYFKAIRSKSPDTKTRVYTNEDLARHGLDSDESEAEVETTAPSRTADDTPSSQPPKLDPLAQMHENKRLAAEREVNLSAARKKLESARSALAELEKRIAAVKNPFLARPAAPKDGAEEWKKMNAAERVERSNRELEAAGEAVTQAENELTSLQQSR